MKLDCYAVLGVSPAAEDVVIRAAYLALMRRYHPDQNASTEAAARTRAIAEAYKMIGDPARRADYDARRADHQFDIPGHGEEAESPPARWRNAPFLGGIAASALAVILAVVLLPQGQGGTTGTARPAQSRAAPESPAKPAATRASNPVRDREPKPGLYRSSAEPVQPLEPPAPRAPREKLAPNPPQLAQPAAKPARPKVDDPLRQAQAAPANRRPALGKASSPKTAPAADNSRLTALERQSTLFYSQSVVHSDGSRRAQLQQARDSFVAARNACRSDSCVGDAYLAHIREVARIMKPPDQIAH